MSQLSKKVMGSEAERVHHALEKGENPLTKEKRGTLSIRIAKS
jgi:hypothetical protein